MNDKLFYARYAVTLTLFGVTLKSEGFWCAVFAFVVANMVWNMCEYSYVTEINIARKRAYFENHPDEQYTTHEEDF